jgi:hypothetical protein
MAKRPSFWLGVTCFRRMPLHSAILLIAFTFSGASEAQAQPQAVQEKRKDYETRCAYLGSRGSFHLIGAGGSAAYSLDGAQFVADLRFNGQDADHWYYKPSNGDQSTREWAFARKPDSCGMYWVWRSVRGWRPYEPTRAWGRGLGEGQVGAAVGAEEVALTKEDVAAIIGFLKSMPQMKQDLERIRKALEK